MAVSHQWFFQWSSPSVVFANINHHYDSANSRWDDWSVTSDSGYNIGQQHSPSWASVKTQNGYVENHKVSRLPAPAPVYENDYELEYEEEIPKYRDRNKLAGITLWLTMMGLSQPQIIPADIETPPFYTLYKWKEIDFTFVSPTHRATAMSSGQYIPENVLPLGLEVWDSRVFVTLPRWRRGIPVTLATVTRYGGAESPPLEPYPDWSFHNGDDSKNCSGITSVFRINADPCGRLWVLDSGQIDSQDNPKQLCPPSLLVFDLNTDKLLARYYIPAKFVKQDSLFSNIIVDTRRKDCKDLHAYIADTWRFGLLVFREIDKQFWRFSHPYFYPDPLASNYTVHGVNFQWADGIFGLALSPLHMLFEEITLFFHPMSSYREFYVSTKVLRDPERVNTSSQEFNLVGESRGWQGQSSASFIDRRGVMFFGLVTQDSIGCWNTKKQYQQSNLAIVSRNTETLVFPNDIKVDQEESQSVWVLSNRLPLYQAGELNPGDYNYRIMFTNTEDAVRGTVCEPPSSSRNEFLKKWFH